MSRQAAPAKATTTTSSTQVSAEELDYLVALSLACEEGEEQEQHVHEERPYDEHMDSDSDSDIDSVGAVKGDCSLKKPKKYSTKIIPPHLLKRPKECRKHVVEVNPYSDIDSVGAVKGDCSLEKPKECLGNIGEYSIDLIRAHQESAVNGSLEKAKECLKQFEEYNPQPFVKNRIEQIPAHRETEWYSNTEPRRVGFEPWTPKACSQVTSKVSPLEENEDNRTPKDPANSGKVEKAVGQVTESDDSIGDFLYMDDDDEDYYIQDESDDEKDDENHGDDENDDDDEEYYYESSVGDDDDNSAQEESSEDSSSSVSSFELVFHGIHSVQDITLEAIENCSSLPDMEHICNVLEASENRSLRKAATKRFLLLRQQEKQEEEDAEFVVVPSNHQKMDAETTKAVTGKPNEDDATCIINNTTVTTSPRKENNRAPNLYSELLKPYTELTAPNLRSAIEMYAKENPEDIGMPMKKLMKVFGIKKKTPKQIQNLFQKIVNQQCLLVNTDETGRVLFLKNSNGDYLGMDDDQGTKQKNTDHSIKEDEEDCKMSAVSIEHIQKCTSIKELQGILARLDESLPRHIAIATARIRELRETIPLSDITASIEDSDDTDGGGSSDALDASDGVAVSPQTTPENCSEDLDYMMALRLQFEDSFEEDLEDFTASQNEQRSSTPPRSNQSGISTNNKAWWNDLDNYGVESAAGGVGQMSTSSLMRHHPIPRSTVPSYSIPQNQTPEFRPPGPFVHVTQPAPGYLQFTDPESNMPPVICPQNPTYSISQNPQLPSFQNYDDSIPNFNFSSSNMTQMSTPQSENIIWNPLTGSYHCPDTGTNVLPSYEPQNLRIVPGYGPLLPRFYYYDDSIPELRDFWEIPCDVERENRALKYIENCNYIPELQGIIRFGSEPENLTSSYFQSSKVYAAIVKRINALSPNPIARSMHHFIKRHMWLIRDSDIELTHNTQDRAFRRKGNIWLRHMIEDNFESFEKNHRYYKTILSKVKEEGRRFFRLGGDQPSHPRLFWIQTDHSDVRAEIFRLFRSERENRIRKSTLKSKWA